MDEIFINLLPDELDDSLLAGDNLEEGNQLPIDIPMAAEPQGIPDEATNAFNMEQDTNIELIELGDSDSDSEREVTEEEEKTVKSIINKKARIDVNVLAERVEELEKVIHKKTANPDSLKVRVKDKSSGETKFFYLNYVQDGRNLNAVKFAKQAKKYIVKSPGAKNGYLKCVCLICRESGQEIIGRSNFLVEHIMRTQKVKIQCVYCDRLVQSHQRSKEHVRKYHWKSGENIVLDKENLKK